MEGDNSVFKTKIRPEKNLGAKPKQVLAATAAAEATAIRRATQAPPQTASSELAAPQAGLAANQELAAPLGYTFAERLMAKPARVSTAVLMRFVGLLLLLGVAVVSLGVAVTQNSLRGTLWMVVTTAITAICFYFSLQEFSDARHKI